MVITLQKEFGSSLPAAQNTDRSEQPG